MIRIMLVDDHAVIREALRAVLEQDRDLQVVAEAGDGEAALRMAEQLTPDVVVMDIALPGQSGIETTRHLLARYPKIKVLTLSTYLNLGIVQQMMDAGASGYIAKSAAGGELQKGIHAVVAGRIHLCAEVIALLDDQRREESSASGKAANALLSKRERQVAILLTEGKTAPEIAAQLHISPRTVDVHRRNLMSKLDLHNVVDLTKYALRTGLIFR